MAADPGLQQYILWGIWALLPLWVIITSFLFFHLRAKFPVSTRQPVIMTFLAIALFIASFLTVLHRLTDIPCALYLGLIFLADNFILTSYFLRALYVHFQLRVIEVINQITAFGADEEVKSLGVRDWHMRNARKCLSNKFYVLLFLVDIILAAAVAVGAGVGTMSSTSDESCSPSSEFSQPINIIRLLTLVIKAVLIFIVAIMLCKYGADSAMVKAELKLVLVFAPPYVSVISLPPLHK